MSAPTVDVLQVVPTLNVGGLERLAADICLALRDRFRLGVACLYGEGPFAEGLHAAGVAVYSWGEQPGRRGAYSAPFRLRRLVRDLRVPVVHSHNLGPFLNSVFATRGAEGVSLLHTDHARNFPDRLHYMLAERLCARAAAQVVAVSAHGKRALVEYEAIPAGHIQVIRNGIDTTPFEALPLPPVARDGEIVVGAAVRLTRQKNLAALLDAVATLVRRDFPVRAVVAGDGPLRGALEAQAQALGIGGRVAFLGYRRDVAAVLADVDVYVLPSIWEGTPLGLLEAMAAGRPTVATHVGGVPEVVVEGETGLLVPPRNTLALAHAIERLCEEPELIHRMGAAARRRALAKFSIDVMTQAYARLYERFLTNGAANGRGARP